MLFMLLCCYYLSLAYSNFTTSQCLICKPIIPWATKLMQSVICGFYSCSPYTFPCGSNISSVVFCVPSTPTLSTSSSTRSPLFQLFYHNNFSWLPNFHCTSLSSPSLSSVPSLLYSCRSLAQCLSSSSISEVSGWGLMKTVLFFLCPSS